MLHILNRNQLIFNGRTSCVDDQYVHGLGFILLMLNALCLYSSYYYGIKNIIHGTATA